MSLVLILTLERVFLTTSRSQYVKMLQIYDMQTHDEMLQRYDMQTHDEMFQRYSIHSDVPPQMCFLCWLNVVMREENEGKSRSNSYKKREPYCKAISGPTIGPIKNTRMMSNDQDTRDKHMHTYRCQPCPICHKANHVFLKRPLVKISTSCSKV